MNTAKSPKQISDTKIKFHKIFLSKPKGRQYSASRKMMTKTEITILIRFARFSVKENPLNKRDASSGFFNSPTIPNAINTNPGQ